MMPVWVTGRPPAALAPGLDRGDHRGELSLGTAESVDDLPIDIGSLNRRLLERG